jgi:lysophospholipase L1-like esterase
LGDSVTAGFGASDKAHSYFGRLLRNPPDDAADVRGLCLSAVLPNLHARNLAVHGTTSIEHLTGQIPRLPLFPRRVMGLVVMSTGGNDIIHNYGQTPPREGAMYGATLRQAEPWIRAFEGRLDHLVTALEARFPGGCRIFLADIYDPTDGVGTAFTVGLPRWPDSTRILSAYNAALRRCAARHASVHLVPVHDAFLGHGIYCRQFWRAIYRRDDPHYWYAPNFEDPNDRGYDALRRLFLREMARVLAPQTR